MTPIKNYTNLKSIERHVANLRRKKIGFPFSLKGLVKLILEVMEYQERPLVKGWLNTATGAPLDEDRPVTSVSMRFGFFSALRQDAYKEILPVTSREELQKTQRYGSIWGIDLFVLRDMPIDEIWVVSDVDKTRKIYKFSIQDDDTIVQLPHSPTMVRLK